MVLQQLIDTFERRASLPLQKNLAGHEKVWFCIYPPRDERRVRARLGDFKIAAERHGLRWDPVDITSAFEDWLGNHEYRESYFRNPELLGPALEDLKDQIVAQLRSRLEQADHRTLTVVLGAGMLFSFVKVSSIVGEVAQAIRGRLLVFFPGRREGNNYRLLDARDGWNYLAVPIEAQE
jgi:hypothetical protein